jgi:flagellin
MPLSFESILDRTTTLGGVSTPKKRRGDQGETDRPDTKSLMKDDRTEAVIGFEDETRRLRQAMRNANAGITLLQIAEGSIEEIQAVLKNMGQMIEQAIQPLREGERPFFQKKLARMVDHINELAERASFEDLHILNGSTATLMIRVQDHEDTICFHVELPNLRADALGLDTQKIDVQSSEHARAAHTVITDIITPVQTQRTYLNAIQQQLEETLHRLESQIEASESGQPPIRAAELAIRTAAVMRECISNDKTGAIAGQIDALHQDAKHLVS